MKTLKGRGRPSNRSSRKRPWPIWELTLYSDYLDERKLRIEVRSFIEAPTSTLESLTEEELGEWVGVLKERAENLMGWKNVGWGEKSLGAELWPHRSKPPAKWTAVWVVPRATTRGRGPARLFRSEHRVKGKATRWKRVWRSGRIGLDLDEKKGWNARKVAARAREIRRDLGVPVTVERTKHGFHVKVHARWNPARIYKTNLEVREHYGDDAGRLGFDKAKVTSGFWEAVDTLFDFKWALAKRTE